MSVVAVCALLIAVNLVLYAQTFHHPFISLDDDQYVLQNPEVRAGLSRHSLGWALTSFYAANWHPLTWLSHMLDVQIFGLSAGAHHMTNLALHIVNALLLFFVLRRMTGAVWRSALVSALFSVHPMHVESVAWIAERKDVLSTVFWLATMGAYARYAGAQISSAGYMQGQRGEQGQQGQAARGWYALSLVALALGLMAKPMLVTMPFVLLLLDYWPLGRLASRLTPARSPRGETAPSARSAPLPLSRLALAPLLREKIPHFGLAFASACVTFVAQTHGGAVQAVDNIPISYRIANTAVAYARYLGSLVWPHPLAVYYPYPPEGWPLALALGGVLLLATITTLVVLARRRCPYLLVGWLWYLGTMVPVIGLVQVGSQSLADRYTYVPFIGLFIMIAWGAADLVELWPRHRAALRRGLGAAIGISLLALAWSSWRQVGFWRDSVVLFERTLAVTKDNAAIHYNLGEVLAERGDVDRAIPHFQEALRLWPRFYSASFNLGIAFASKGQFDEAVKSYERALSVNPASVEAHVNLGSVLGQVQQIDRAAEHFKEAIRLDPKHPGARVNLGWLLLQQGKIPEATLQLQEGARLAPASFEAHNNLGLALHLAGDQAGAIAAFTRALEIRPGDVRAIENLRRARMAASE